MAGSSRAVHVDVAALQEIIETADAVPAIAVGLEQQFVAAALVGLAVVFREQVHKRLAGLAGNSHAKREFARLLIEVMDEQPSVVAPPLPDDQHGRVAPDRN